MCGIWLLCGMQSFESLHCNDCFTKISHRGPDAWRLEMDARMQNILLGTYIASYKYCFFEVLINFYSFFKLICVRVYL